MNYLAIRNRYADLRRRRDLETMTTKYVEWRRAINRLKAVEQHLSRIDRFFLTDREWLAIYHRRTR